MAATVTPTLTKPFARYPHTRRLGAMVFIAGQGCRDPITDNYAGLTLDAEGKVASYDIKAQTRGVIANMERALVSEGLTLQHLVDVTVFLADMDDFQKMNEIWNEFFSHELAPTRTTVAVTALPGLNFVEMKGIAVAR